MNKNTFWNNFPKANFDTSQVYEYGFNIEPSTNNRANKDYLCNDFSLNASVDGLNLAKFKE